MTDDFFRARIEQMIDLRHPLAVLAQRLPWDDLERALVPCFARDPVSADGSGAMSLDPDLFGPTPVQARSPSNAGRPRLPIRLMISLLYLKHAFNLSDEELVLRWSENVVWQYFSGMQYHEPRLPCDGAQISRFRSGVGEAGVEELLKATLDTAVAIKAIRPAELERVIVDTTVQEKAVAHPTDSRLLEASRYGHARQFRRMRRVIARQRTITGRLLRDLERKLVGKQMSRTQFDRLQTLIGRVRRILTQRSKDKNKLYALHAPEVECISKGKAKRRYEFGVKVTIAVTHKRRLMLGARSFPGNPYDGHILAAQIEQSNILLEDTGKQVKQVFADLGFRGVDRDNPGIQICHRGKLKSLSRQQRRWLRRRPAVEPAIGHVKSDNRMDRCWLKGQEGDAIHVVLCAAGYNIRWLLRAVAQLGLVAIFLRLILAALIRRLQLAHAQIGRLGVLPPMQIA